MKNWLEKTSDFHLDTNVCSNNLVIYMYNYMYVATKMKEKKKNENWYCRLKDGN